MYVKHLMIFMFIIFAYKALYASAPFGLSQCLLMEGSFIHLIPYFHNKLYKCFPKEVGMPFGGFKSM